MAYVYKRGDVWWVRVKEGGKWVSKRTEFRVSNPDDRRRAKRYAESGQREADAKATGAPSTGPLTVRAYVDKWIVTRREADQDYRTDMGRLTKHVLPVIGDLVLASVRASHVADLVHRLRFPADPERRIAQRTVYNVYSVVSALFRDAAIGGLVEQTPCVLTKRQLGPILDKDPKWRAGAVFTRAEAEALISDPRIPADRQLVYGFGLLGGTRPGEVSALRWSDYDATVAPLGKITIAAAYSTRYDVVRGTKTGAVRYLPVHPTLATMLDAWRATGWAAMMGREPTPGDLILPLPPVAAARRVTREGDAYRPQTYTDKCWRYEDLPALGWRARSMYATKSTFITLAIEDGADRSVIRDRVTHARPRRDAFDGYDRGAHWDETCREVSKLRLARVTVRVTVPGFSSVATVREAGLEGSIALDDARPQTGAPTTISRVDVVSAGTIDHGLSHDRVTAGLDGDRLRRPRYAGAMTLQELDGHLRDLVAPKVVDIGAGVIVMRMAEGKYTSGVADTGPLGMNWRQFDASPDEMRAILDEPEATRHRRALVIARRLPNPLGKLPDSVV